MRTHKRVEDLEKILVAKIKQGELSSGVRLPPERKISEELGFSRNTIRKTYQAMHHKGLLHYKNRAYWISQDIESFGVLDEGLKSVAIFYHMEDVDKSLLLAIEKALRIKKINPLNFNMESLESSQGMNLLSYLHVDAQAAFFLGTRVGQKGEELKKSWLETLPLPYCFLGVEPSFECHRVLMPEPLVCAQKSSRLMQKYSEVHLSLSWPLSPWEGKFLQHLSRESPDYFKADSSHSIEFIPFGGKAHQPKGKNKLWVSTPKILSQIKIREESVELLCLGAFSGVPSLRVRPEIMVREAFRLMSDKEQKHEQNLHIKKVFLEN